MIIGAPAAQRDKSEIDQVRELTVSRQGMLQWTVPSGHYYLTDPPTDSRESTGNLPVDSLESVGGSVGSPSVRSASASCVYRRAIRLS